jgi:hypothetical protein
MIRAVRSLMAERLADGEPVLALPSLAELYPILGLRAPVYDLYCVYPASDAEQERMLRSIEAAPIRLAVIEDRALDGREELRFSRTHPRVWSHLQSAFEPLAASDAPSGCHIFYRSRSPCTHDPAHRPPGADS